MATVIKIFGSDPHLLRYLRDTGFACVAAPRESLSSLAHSSAPQPTVLVVDIRDTQLFPLELGAFRRQHPTTGVLLVVASLEPNLMLEAMRAGVNELIADPLTESEVQNAIKRLVGSHAPAIRGDVYALVGAKGGVGTTTVAVNLATALAKASAESTLLMDLNTVCGDAAVFLGLESGAPGRSGNANPRMQDMG